MDDEAKQRLDAIFADDKAKVEQAEKAKNDEAEAQAEFLAAFIGVRDSVLIPAMKEFAAYIRTHGWNGDCELIEDLPEIRGTGDRIQRPARPASVQMTFYRGETRPTIAIGGSFPHFRVVVSKTTKNVYFHESTIGPNHGGSAGGAGNAKLEQLTVSYLQDRMVSFFKRMMSEAKSYHR